MTPDQADQILLTLAATWNTKISDPTIIMWRNRLQQLDYNHTQTAVNHLADTSKWWPAWSEIVDATNAAKRAAGPVYEALQVSGVVLSAEENRAKLAECRVTLDRGVSGVGCRVPL